MNVLFAVFILIWGIALGLTVWGTWYAHRQFSRGNQYLKTYPPVSILKPLKGVDSGLSNNLESFFHLDYPQYELVFSVGSESDPAYPVVLDLIRMYPEIKSRVVINSLPKVLNPKINNLIESYELAKFDTVLISDSNVRVKPDYLSQLVPHLQGKVGMVTSVVLGTYPKGWGALLEATFLNTFYARWMHVSEAFGVPAVVGKSMLFTKTTLNRIGGIRVLSNYIAEDFMAGEAVQKLGLKVALATHPVPQYIGEYSFQAFWQRHLRWGRIRKSMLPLAFLPEPLLSSIISGILGAIGCHALFSFNPFLFFAGHIFFWWGCELVLLSKLGQLRANAAFAWFLREILGIGLWVNTLLGNTVQWRGKEYQLYPGGILEPC